MCKILVTGSSGFIGSALVKTLLANGFTVKRLVRNQLQMYGGLTYSNLNAVHPSLKFFEEFEVMIHLAGKAHVPKNSSVTTLEQYRIDNRDKTVLLAKNAAKVGIKRFIFLSSIGVNGDATFGIPFGINDAPRPVSPYSISKYEAELALKSISLNTGLEVVIIRSPLVYGQNVPGNFSRLITMIKTGIPLPFGSITQNKRTFIGLDNLIDLIKICIKHPNAVNKIFLAGDIEDLSTADLISRLARAGGLKPNLISMPDWLLKKFAYLIGREGDMEKIIGSLQVDNSYACNTLDWYPSVSIEEGFYKTMR